MSKQVLVIKVGSAIISMEDGTVNLKTISRLADEISILQNKYHIVLVSSGAVACGKKFIENYKATITQKKAAAAIGNPILIGLYDKYFKKHGYKVAQALCERHHFANRIQFLQLRETFETFWQCNIIPVVNENDLVSNNELKFSDNDELATLLSIGLNAGMMILCTSAGGLRNNHGAIIQTIHKIDKKILALVTNEKSSSGLGGMLSKLTFTKLAVSLGINVIMCGLEVENSLRQAVNSKHGTFFPASNSTLKARQKWLASGSLTLGSVVVDTGAVKALGLRKSLLTVGIKKVSGNFAAGEVVQLENENGSIIGVAKTKMPSELLQSNLKEKNKIAAHADDIVLFE